MVLWMSMFSLLCSMVNNYLEGVLSFHTLLMSHPGFRIMMMLTIWLFFSWRPYFLLLLVDYDRNCFASQGECLTPLTWALVLCSVEVSVHHRAFLVTEGSFSMTATSVLMQSYSLAEKTLLWVKPTSSGRQGSLLGIWCYHLFLLRTWCSSCLFSCDLYSCWIAYLH